MWQLTLPTHVWQSTLNGNLLYRPSWGLWEYKLPGIYDNLLYLGLLGIYRTWGL